MNKRTFSLFTISIILALLSWGGYVGMQILMTHSLERANILRDEVVIARARTERFNEIEAAKSETEPLIKKIDVHIIGAKEEDTAEFLGFLGKIAREAGAKTHISSLVYNPTEGGAGLIEDLKINVTVEGSWSGWFRFLKSIEELPYNLVIHRSILTSGSGGANKSAKQWTGMIDFSVKAFKPI